MDWLTSPTGLLSCGLLYLLLCGLAGCYASNQRGRDFGEGLVLGLLLGPFGVIVAAVLPSVELHRPPAIPAEKPATSRAIH